MPAVMLLRPFLPIVILLTIFPASIHEIRKSINWPPIPVQQFKIKWLDYLANFHVVSAETPSWAGKRDLLAQQQLANALAGGIEDGVKQCRRRRWRAGLSRLNPSASSILTEIMRRLQHAQRQGLVEVGLLGGTGCEGISPKMAALRPKMNVDDSCASTLRGSRTVPTSAAMNTLSTYAP